MNVAPSKKCPACWSTVDLRDPVCPQCGERFERQGGRSTFIVLALTLVLGTAGAWWIARPGGAEPAPEDKGPGPVVETRPDPKPALPAPQEAAPAQPAAPFLPVFGPQGETATAALVVLAGARDGRQHFCIPAGLMPTEGPLHDARGEVLDVAVVTWDELSGMVLLVGPEVPDLPALQPGDVRSLAPSTVFDVQSPLGTRGGGIRAEPHTVPLVTDRIATAGSVLTDPAGRVVAVMGTAQFHPVHLLLSWLRQWEGEPLAAVQHRIRAADPRYVLEDAERLLDNDTTDAGKVDAAILLLQRSQHLARELSVVQAFDRMNRFAHHQRVRIASAHDGVQALRYARESLSLFGDHYGIQADTVLLQLMHGDALQGLHLYRGLLGASPDHARKIADEVAREAARAVQERLRAGQSQQAVELAALAVQILPGRAPLHMAYAEALLRAGDRIGAEAQSREAARLDEAFAARSRQLQAASATAARGRGTVRIPFDPQRKQIRTKGVTGGRSLELVVDTGASYTTVPRSVAAALGLLGPANERVKVDTANGPAVAERVVLPDLVIAGQIHLRQVPALVMDLPGGLDGRGLLGLDVLQKLNMRIDSERSELVLRQPSRRKRR